jgi:hypothetical protein
MMFTRQSLCGLRDGVDAYGNPQRGDATQVTCANIQGQGEMCWNGGRLLMGGPNATYVLVPWWRMDYLLDPANRMSEETTKTVFVVPITSLDNLNLNTDARNYAAAQLGLPSTTPAPGVDHVVEVPKAFTAADLAAAQAAVAGGAPLSSLSPVAAAAVRMSPGSAAPALHDQTVPMIAPVAYGQVPITQLVTTPLTVSPPAAQGEDGFFGLDSTTLMIGAAALVGALFLFGGKHS